MNFKKTAETGAKLALLNAVCFAGLMAMPAVAQDATTDEEIVVTGFRASLTSSTNAKRDATAFTDSVFAEDIGQMPDLNIAESLNRIPGITVSREVNGEGLNIAIRGLNTNFTKTVLNGNQIAVASSGSADSQGVNRELDLDVFPSELFTRLDVSKSPSANLLEGGVAGIVNMRSARPFDFENTQFTYSIQENYGSQSESWSPRAAFLASGRWDTGIGEFGVLFGYAGVRNNSTTLGYETIGMTNANLTYRQCGVAPPVGTGIDTPAASCNLTGGNGFQIAAPSGTVPVVPASGASAGLTPGATVDAAFLLANNPGLTIDQIGNALIPRLGRPAYFDGDRDRDAALVSLQYSPNPSMEFYLDIMGAQATRSFNRIDLMMEVRSFNSMIPINMQVDENNVVTSGTFVNERLFLEARPYNEDLEFINVNPGGHFEFGENVQVDLQANVSRSVFFRSQPTVGLALTGVNVDFTNDGGDQPTFDYAQNANDPNAGWSWVRAFLQNEKRVTATRGLHLDTLFGDTHNNIRVGFAWDQIERTITGLQNTRAWQNFTCGGGQPVTVDGGCNGAPGSAIETSEIGQYLTPGPAGFVTPLYDQIFAATNYQQFFDTATFTNGAATGANSGGVDESTLGAYIEANGEAEILDRSLRFNLGTRYINTDQTITGPQTIAGAFAGFQSLDSNYSEYLPSFNAVYELTDDINLRMAASRTLTRQNPNAMLPNTTFSDPGAQNANQGNPNLTPFLSTNYDFGGEWYTGGEGFIGVALFNKTLTGFTQTGTNTIPFLDLGIPFDTLSQPQRDAINGRGGPTVATVTVSQQVNAGGALNIRGYELTWVQPLDVILDGLGFTANYTRINQSGSGSGAPAIATNVSPVTYSVTGYYENFGFSGRVSYTWNDAQQQTSSPQDNFGGTATQPQAGHRFTDARGQLDAAFRYTIEALPSSPQLTLDLININGATRRETQGYDNLVYKFYDPGYSVLLGVRGTF
jgi:TonB-dependent receptor